MPPLGPLSLCMANLRTILAACPAFQAWVGAANMTEAAARIHIAGVAAADAVRPFAVVDLGDKWAVTNSGGGAGLYLPRGELKLYFEADVAADDADSDADAAYSFLNPVGLSLEEMQGLSGTDGYLSIHGIEFGDDPPTRSIDDDASATEDYYFATFVVTWSV